MIQDHKDQCIENEKNDEATFYLIKQGLVERFIPKIVPITSSKEAQNIFELTYSERGSNTDQHQSKLQSIATIDEVTIVIEEVE